jgi:predicted dehydrogenase
MVDAVKKSGRIVQIGFQRRQSAAFQAVRKHVQDGDAGKIICAEANIHYTAGTKDATPQEPPSSLDWNLWCGPGPKIPYSPQVGHVNWRLEKTSGQGHLVDWGIHLIDAARVILGEGMPRSVSASGGLYYLKGRITTPDVLTAHFEFAGCPLTWRHRIWGAEEYSPEVSNGIFFFGEKETIFVTDDRWETIPRGKRNDRQVHPAPADAGSLHMAEFLNAVRTRQLPGCLAEDAYASTTAVKLAMISYDTGSKVSWDAAQEQIPGNPPAAQLLKREYRPPWKHPYQS